MIQHLSLTSPSSRGSALSAIVTTTVHCNTMMPLVTVLLLLLSIDAVQAFSASSSSSSSSSSSTPTLFSQFVFSPNGVCIQPSQFIDFDDSPARSFTMKNVPGDGDCMFLATALAAATSMGLGANNVLLRKLARETRHAVADILETDSEEATLLIEGNRLVSTHQLLQSAAKEEGVPPNVYLQQLRKEGCEGGLYGGGPELTVLSNVLRRPISIYELAVTTETDVTGLLPSEIVNDSEQCRIVCQGVFGLPHFADPCQSIPQSAILQPNLQPGAYSWHLHLLIVQASATSGEKHACVLLPQTPI